MKRPEIKKTDGVCLEVEYGNQRDNTHLGKGFENWAQCGYEMTAMLLSQDIKGATDNDYVVSLIKDMEPNLDPNGWGGQNLKQIAKETWYGGGRIGQYVEAHGLYLTYKTGLPATVRKYKGTWNNLIAVVLAGRAVGFCTKITDSGHFIIVVGIIYGKGGPEALICHDPYGDANTNYKSKDGAYVTYRTDWLKAGRCWGDPSGMSLTYVYIREGA